MEPIDERLLLEVIEEVLGNEYLEELSEMDTALAMGIIEIIEDGIRLYHAKTIKKYFEEMEKEHLSKL